MAREGVGEGKERGRELVGEKKRKEGKGRGRGTELEQKKEIGELRDEEKREKRGRGNKGN